MERGDQHLAMWRVVPWFGELVVRHALADLGVREDLGRNDGQRIREYANHFGLIPPVNWCALAVSCWLLEASLECATCPPIAGSPAARGVMGQLIEAGLWVPYHRIQPLHLAPGTVIVWWRGARDGWQGHIGIVEQQLVPMATVQTIEGNSGQQGDRVARMTRELNDPRLLGVGCFGPEAPRQVDERAVLAAAPYRDLSSEVMLGEPRDPLGEFDEHHTEGT